MTHLFASNENSFGKTAICMCVCICTYIGNAGVFSSTLLKLSFKAIIHMGLHLIIDLFLDQLLVLISHQILYEYS